MPNHFYRKFNTEYQMKTQHFIETKQRKLRATKLN